MFKKYQNYFIIILVVIAMWFALTSKKPNTVSDLGKNPILFYSTTCPHCKNVEDYLTKNKVKTKIKLVELNVAETSSVQKYQKAVEICQVPASQTGGVPLLYVAGKCYFGDVDVIDYFKEKLKK